MLYKVTSLDAAKDQLNWAIYLLVNDNALIPSITLAGAAEEILAKSLPEDRRAFSVLKDELSKEFPDAGKELNRIKNALKHWEIDTSKQAVDSIEVELEVQAAVLVFRAMLNFRRVHGTYPHGYKEFIAWCQSKSFHAVAVTEQVNK